MLNEQRAIVSSIAGTTRDTIEEVLTINGTDFRLIDTAGIRKTSNEIEKIGVEKTLKKINQSSIVIYIYDCAETKQQEVSKDLKKYIDNNIPYIVVANKIDLQKNINEINKTHFKTSLNNKDNIEDLKKLIYNLFDNQNINNGDIVISNARHFEALKLAHNELIKVKKGLIENKSGDLVAMDIRQILYYIGTITGEISSDELLGNIFAKFCIGK